MSAALQPPSAVRPSLPSGPAGPTVRLRHATASGLTIKSALAFGPKDLSAPFTNALFGSFSR
ncbi:hypothetical protein ACKI1O_08225 [Streptomyces scabiei]